MRKIIALFVCVFLAGICFAEKIEVMTDDITKVGVMELASEGNTHVICLCKMEAVFNNPRVKSIHTIILMKFNDYATAKNIYDDCASHIRGYYDFHQVYESVNNIPVIRDTEVKHYIEGGILYNIKNLEQ